MTANFTSGWLGQGERAWHGMGVVTEGTLPPREAFETADALFTVEKRELFYPTEPDSDGRQTLRFYQPSGTFGVVRTDTQQLLGVVVTSAIRNRPERFTPSDGRVHPRRG